MRQLETKTLSMETEFRKLQDQAQYKENVEPCFYVGKLLLGILCMIISGILILLETSRMTASYKNETYADFDFINKIIEMLNPEEG